MSLSKRTDGRWVVKYKDSLSGKWRQRAFRSQADALRFEDDCQYDRREHERLTLGDAVAAFVANVPHVPRTVAGYSFLVNGYDRKDGGHTEGPAEFLADKYCSELTRRDLENLRLRLRERGQSVYTMNLNVYRLKAAMNWAVEQDLLESNPWAKYKGLPGVRHKSRQAKLDDFRKVYAVLPPWMQWACRTALALCLRPGVAELFSLTWDRFDWRGRCVAVAMPKVGREKIVFPPEAYLEEAWERFQEDSAAGQTVVCRGKRGRPLLETPLYANCWAHACRKAGVTMAFYAIRHIAASEMLAAGADLAAVAAQLGHKNVATTAAFYTHAVASAQRRASLALPSLDLVRNGAAGKQKSKKNQGVGK